jgi:hypothetical protein
MTDREHDDLLTTATDRFERRLAEECGSLRTEIGDLRVDTVTQGTEIRLEMAKLRLDMSEQFGDVRLDAETKHRELLKWALVFWVGQAASVAAIVGAFN